MTTPTASPDMQALEALRDIEAAAEQALAASNNRKASEGQRKAAVHRSGGLFRAANILRAALSTPETRETASGGGEVDGCLTPGFCTCPGMSRCSECGYTEHDKRHLMDHFICDAKRPAPTPPPEGVKAGGDHTAEGREG